MVNYSMHSSYMRTFDYPDHTITCSLNGDMIFIRVVTKPIHYCYEKNITPEELQWNMMTPSQLYDFLCMFIFTSPVNVTFTAQPKTLAMNVMNSWLQLCLHVVE